MALGCTLKALRYERLLREQMAGVYSGRITSDYG